MAYPGSPGQNPESHKTFVVVVVVVVEYAVIFTSESQLNYLFT